MRYHDVDRVADLPDHQLREIANGNRPTGLWSQAPRAAEWELAERRRERVQAQQVVQERNRIFAATAVAIVLLLVLWA